LTTVFINSRFLTQEVSGVQRYAAEIALGLKSLDSSIRFLAPRNIRQNAWAQALGVEVVGSCAGHLWEQVELPHFLRRSTGALLVNLANTAPLFVHRQVVTVHDLSFLTHPEWFAWRFRKFYHFLIPRIVRNCTHVIANSEFTRGELMHKLNLQPSRISVVSPTVSATFQEGDGESPPVAGDFILAVSSLDPRKNLDAVIRAYRLLQRFDLKLVLVGSQHKSFSRVGLVIEPAEDRRILRMGRVSDGTLAALYRGARLFVYPSLYEGFGLPPLEAMASGCPCVVSRAAALPEVLGDAALYCDAYDVRDIAAQMQRLLVDSPLREELISRGRTRAHSFSREQSAARLHAVIRQLA
jgi:glycosyltransferase involved in cell wall biosynthesis